MKKAIFLATFILVSALLTGSFVLAGACPQNTMVQGTTVTFVGELTDTGGDSSTYVWFEYGKSISYGQKTTELVLNQSGLYCINVSGLSPCTTYYYRAAARNSAGTSYGANKTFTTSCLEDEPTIDFRVNNVKGSITISYDTSAVLSWTSKNANYCSASGNWSGTKSVSGSESTGKLTSSKTYTLACSGPGGEVSESIKVHVGSQTLPDEDAEFYIKKTVRNLSKETVYSDLTYANPGEILTFGIVVKAGNDPIYNIVVKDVLPSGIIYRGELMVDNVLTTGDIFTGLNIGSLAAGDKKTITFRGDVAGADSFSLGQTELTNSVSVSSGGVSHSDIAKIVVTKGAIAGAATDISTGLTNNIFFDSFFLPLAITLLIIWLAKSRIIKFEEWMDSRKKEYRTYKSKKILQMKVGKIKARELFRRII